MKLVTNLIGAVLNLVIAPAVLLMIAVALGAGQ